MQICARFSYCCLFNKHAFQKRPTQQYLLAAGLVCIIDFTSKSITLKKKNPDGTCPSFTFFSIATLKVLCLLNDPITIQDLFKSSHLELLSHAVKYCLNIGTGCNLFLILKSQTFRNQVFELRICSS